MTTKITKFNPPHILPEVGDKIIIRLENGAMGLFIVNKDLGVDQLSLSGIETISAYMTGKFTWKKVEED